MTVALAALVVVGDTGERTVLSREKCWDVCRGIFAH